MYWRHWNVGGSSVFVGQSVMNFCWDICPYNFFFLKKTKNSVLKSKTENCLFFRTQNSNKICYVSWSVGIIFLLFLHPKGVFSLISNHRQSIAVVDTYSGLIIIWGIYLYGFLTNTNRKWWLKFSDISSVLFTLLQHTEKKLV